MLDYTANGVSCAVIRRAQAGDLAAFAELVQHCRRRTMGIIRRLISRPEDVDDVAQEVFYRMYVSLGRLRVPESFDFWLYRLTTNGAYDYLRKRPRLRDVLMADLEVREMDAAAASASWQILRDQQDRLRTVDTVDRLLQHLSPSDRILIVMREVEGLTMEELSLVFGVRVGAVKARLFRARNRLREAFHPGMAKAAPAALQMTLAAQNT